MTRAIVVLPAPFGPSMVANVPAASESDSPVTTGLRPYAADTSLSSSSMPGWTEIGLEDSFILLHFAGRPVRDLLAMIQDDDALRGGHHDAHIVLDEEERNLSSPMQVSQHPEDLVLLVTAQPRHRLIKKDQSRFRDDRSRDFQEFESSKGQVAGEVLGVVSQTEQIQHVEGSFLSVALGSCVPRQTQAG